MVATISPVISFHGPSAHFHSEDVHCKAARQSHLAIVLFLETILECWTASASCKEWQPTVQHVVLFICERFCHCFTSVGRARTRASRRVGHVQSRVHSSLLLNWQMRAPTFRHSLSFRLLHFCVEVVTHCVLSSHTFASSSRSFDQPCALAEFRKLPQSCSKFFPLVSLLWGNLHTFSVMASTFLAV